MKILIVEDNRYLQDLMKKFLEDIDGHNVTIVSSVEDASIAFSPDKFEILAVDYAVEDGTTEGFVKEVRDSGYSGLMIAISGDQESNSLLCKIGCTCKVTYKSSAIEEIRQLAGKPK